MKYLILIQSNPEWSAAWASFTPEQQAEGYAVYQRLNDELRESGEFVDAEQLAGPDTARTVSVVEHGPVASDAPLAETKEFLGGYYLVDVDSFDRAVEIAARLPESALGLVRLHPILSRTRPRTRRSRDDGGAGGAARHRADAPRRRALGAGRARAAHGRLRRQRGRHAGGAHRGRRAVGSATAPPSSRGPGW